MKKSLRRYGRIISMRLNLEDQSAIDKLKAGREGMTRSKIIREALKNLTKEK